MTSETVVLNGQGDLMLHDQSDLMLLGQGDSRTPRGSINETCSQDIAKKVSLEIDQGLQKEAFNRMSVRL